MGSHSVAPGLDTADRSMPLAPGRTVTAASTMDEQLGGECLASHRALAGGKQVWGQSLDHLGRVGAAGGPQLGHCCMAGLVGTSSRHSWYRSR